MYIQEPSMQIAKWGNSLAVRLPAALVEELGLAPGDEVAVLPEKSATGAVTLRMRRKPGRDELIADLGRLAWALPPDYQFNRDEANARDNGR
jgi:antitoxin MazE